MTTHSVPHPTALITGASRGLGLALARDLAADGWQLVIDGRDRAALESAATELARLTSVHPVAGDVSDADHRVVLGAVVRDLGGADLVVHNASTLGDPHREGPALRPVDTYPVDSLRRVFDVNVVAPLALTQVLVPHLRPGAQIVAVTSDAAVEAYEGWGGYGASKAALDQLFAVLAVEHPEITIYRVDPGEMRTRMYQEAEPGEDISGLPLPEVSVPGIRHLLRGNQPSGRYTARSVPQEVHG